MTSELLPVDLWRRFVFRKMERIILCFLRCYFMLNFPMELFSVDVGFNKCVMFWKYRSLIELTLKSKLTNESFSHACIWRVREHCFHSNHQAIFLVVENGGSDSRGAIEMKKYISQLVHWGF